MPGPDKESNPWPDDHPIPVAGAILDRGDEILLVRDKRLDEFWLVSGWLEAWESAEDAMIREVREEVGLDISAPKIVGSYSCRPIGLNVVFIVYAAQVAKTAQVVIGDEIAEARWYRKDRLPDWPPDSPAAIAMTDYLGR
jgi:NAD+ diphosphatase